MCFVHFELISPELASGLSFVESYHGLPDLSTLPPLTVRKRRKNRRKLRNKTKVTDNSEAGEACEWGPETAEDVVADTPKSTLELTIRERCTPEETIPETNTQVVIASANDRGPQTLMDNKMNAIAENEQLKRELSDVQARHDILADESNSFRSVTDDYEEQLRNLRLEVARINIKHEDAEKLADKTEQELRDERGLRLRTGNECQKAKEDLNIIVTERQQMNDVIDTLHQQHDQSEIEKRDLRTLNSELLDKNKELQLEIHNRLEELQDYRHEIEQANIEIQTLRDRVDELTRQREESPLRLEPVEIDGNIKSFADELQELEAGDDGEEERGEDDGTNDGGTVKRASHPPSAVPSPTYDPSSPPHSALPSPTHSNSSNVQGNVNTESTPQTAFPEASSASPVIKTAPKNGPSTEIVADSSQLFTTQDAPAVPASPTVETPQAPSTALDGESGTENIELTSQPGFSESNPTSPSGSTHPTTPTDETVQTVQTVDNLVTIYRTLSPIQGWIHVYQALWQILLDLCLHSKLPRDKYILPLPLFSKRRHGPIVRVEGDGAMADAAREELSSPPFWFNLWALMLHLLIYGLIATAIWVLVDTSSRRTLWLTANTLTRDVLENEMQRRYTACNNGFFTSILSSVIGPSHLLDVVRFTLQHYITVDRSHTG